MAASSQSGAGSRSKHLLGTITDLTDGGRYRRAGALERLHFMFRPAHAAGNDETNRHA